jgi:hypothetical protein
MVSEQSPDDAVVYAALDGVVLREIAGEHLLVPIRSDLADMEAIYALMGVGVRIWGLLDGTRTLGAIREELVARYDVGADEAWADLCDFVMHLEERGLVERRI